MGIIVVMSAMPVIAAAVAAVWLLHGLAPALLALVLGNVAVLVALGGLGALAGQRAANTPPRLRVLDGDMAEGDDALGKPAEPAPFYVEPERSAKSRR